jgi:membrane-associated protease RseP (regulator of RpoE activity)
MPRPAKKKPLIQEALRKPVSLLFGIGSLLIIIFLYYSGLSLYITLPSALISLAITGIVISSANGFDGFYGFYMLKSKRGLNLIDNISKSNITFWKTLAEWGAVLGFGLLAYVIFRKKINKKALILGYISIILIVLVISPNFGLVLKFLNLPGLSQYNLNITSLTGPTLSLQNIVLLIVSLVGGFTFYFIFLIGLISLGTLYNILTALSTAISGHPNYTSLSQQIPGVAPLIPGFTIPLFSGLLALAVVLIVHEFSHGVLSRIAKIKLKSIGLLPFGIIPIGAFVEPDEKEVERLDKDRQNDIFIAGIASNFLLTFVFFLLTTLMILYVMPLFFASGVIIQATVPGAPAYNIITPGSIVYYWNGYRITNLTNLVAAEHNFTPFATVTVNTNRGNYSIRSNSTGKIGVLLEQYQVPRSPGIQNGLINFVYTFFVLSFVINFFVGAMNLLPLPAFDGWRIYKNRIKSKRTLNAIALLVLIGIVILALPWIWVL